MPNPPPVPLGVKPPPGVYRLKMKPPLGDLWVLVDDGDPAKATILNASPPTRLVFQETGGGMFLPVELVSDPVLIFYGEPPDLRCYVKDGDYRFDVPVEGPFPFF